MFNDCLDITTQLEIPYCNKSDHSMLESARFNLTRIEYLRKYARPLSKKEEIFEGELLDYLYGRAEGFVKPFPKEKVEAIEQGRYEEYRKQEIMELKRLEEK